MLIGYTFVQVRAHRMLTVKHKNTNTTQTVMRSFLFFLFAIKI